MYFTFYWTEPDSISPKVTYILLHEHKFTSMKPSYILYVTEAYFTENFSIMMQIWRKIHVSVIFFVDIKLL